MLSVVIFKVPFSEMQSNAFFIVSPVASLIFCTTAGSR